MIQIQKLKQILKGEISDNNADLDKYRHDASIFDIKPELIIYPNGVEDLRQLVTWVSQEKSSSPSLSITARSAGTDMGGGSVNDSIIIDFTRHFNHIIEIGKDYAISEPGVYYRDFEKQTLLHGLLMPSYPASRGLCAIGGIVSNNSGGEKSLSYGKTERYVEEIWAVLADGNEYHFGPLDEAGLEAKLKLSSHEGQLYRDVFHLIKENYDLLQKARPNVTKNSAGYYLWDVWDKKTFNMARLLVGSQGTLGLVTKVKLRLITPKPHSEMLIMFLDDLAPLGDLVNTVMSFKPESFESFDDHTMGLAVKFLPAMLKKMSASGPKGPGEQFNIFKLAWEFLPEMFMTVTGGLPKLILLAEFTGDHDEEIFVRMKLAQKTVQAKYGIRTHVTKNEHEEQKYWTVRRESFNLLREKVKNLHTAPFVDDFSVHPADLPQFLPRLDAIFKQYPTLIYTIAGHAGDANFHIIPLMDFTKQSERDIIPKLSHEVYNLVLEYKGTITSEHNDGLVRGPYLQQMYGSKVFELFKDIKRIFDPLNILNPHKKTDATEEFMVAHIRKD